MRDRSGATTDTILPNMTAETFRQELEPIVAKDAVLVSDGRDAYGAFAYLCAILHMPINASRGEHVYEGFHIQNVNGYVSRLKNWMVRFKGRRLELPVELPRMATHDRARRRPPHPATHPLSGHRCVTRYVIGEQSHAERPTISSRDFDD